MSHLPTRYVNKSRASTLYHQNGTLWIWKCPYIFVVLSVNRRMRILCLRGRLRGRLKGRLKGRLRGRLRGRLDRRRQNNSMVRSRTKFLFRVCVSTEASIGTPDPSLPLFEFEIVAFVTCLGFERTRGVFVFVGLHGLQYTLVLFKSPQGNFRKQAKNIKISWEFLVCLSKSSVVPCTLERTWSIPPHLNHTYVI